MKKQFIKLLEAQHLDIDSKQFSRKQNVSPGDVFLFETLHNYTVSVTKGHTCLTQAVILSSTSIFITTLTVLCNNM